MDHMNWQRARDILISVICIGIILWATWGIAGQFAEAIVILLLSMAVAFLLNPGVNFLVKYQVPRVVAALTIYIVALVLLGALSYGLVFSLIRQVQGFSNTVITYFTALPETLSSLRTLLIKNGIPSTNIDTAVEQIRNQAVGFAQSAASNALNIVIVVSGALLNIFLVTVLSFYFVIDGKRIRDSIISIAPQRSMPHVLVFEDALNRVVGNYIRGQLTLAAIIGVLSGLVCLATGLGQFALIIGVLAFLFETIPMVGPALASVPALAISLLLPQAFPRTFIVAGCFVLIQMIESNVLGPRIVGHAVGLHPVASILALLVFAKLFGPFGALIATPIVAAIWVVIASVYRSARGETADQMLARKRAPWTLRRPTSVPGLRGRKRTSALDGGGGGSGDGQPAYANTSSGEYNRVPTNSRAGDAVHMEIAQDDHVQMGKEEDGKRVISIERSSDRT